MANSIVVQPLGGDITSTIQVKYNLIGDGSEEWDKVILFDASLYFGNSTEDKLVDMEYCLNGFSAQLFWGATTDVPLISLAKDHPHYRNYGIYHVGGLTNNGAAGRTGDILISSAGATGEDVSFDGHIIITVKNKQESER